MRGYVAPPRPTSRTRLAAAINALIMCSQACASECSMHADRYEHCRVCADACNQCEDACRELLSSMG